MLEHRGTESMCCTVSGTSSFALLPPNPLPFSLPTQVVEGLWICLCTAKTSTLSPLTPLSKAARKKGTHLPYGHGDITGIGGPNDLPWVTNSTTPPKVAAASSA